jgi:hypothetical protein
VPYAAANGLNMYYEVRGDGPPLLLLHGGSGSIAERWIPAEVTPGRAESWLPTGLRPVGVLFGPSPSGREKAPAVGDPFEVMFTPILELESRASDQVLDGA